MFFNKRFNCIAFFLMAVVLCTGIPVATGEDSAQSWLDSETGLTWTVKDNGEDVGWNQARGYCESMELDGFTDWRLPTIDELKTIYDKSQSKRYKAKGPIELEMATIWSSSTNNVGDVWSLNFSYGGKSLSPTSGCSSSGRTLCVRKDAE
jgi:hypothetical protein